MSGAELDTKEQVGRRLRELALLEGDFVLRSGRRSSYYLDKYLFETDPQVLRGITREFGRVVRARQAAGAAYDRLAAPELGAVALAAALSLEVGLPFLIVRKASKEYGTGKDLEGRWEPGDRVALVEDVVTSGGAALLAVECLRSVGLIVEDLFCVVDREEGGGEAAAAAGLTLCPLFTVSGLGVAARGAEG
jgi:orotate phosphoribosyltransferase